MMNGTRLLVKVGGAAVEEPAGRARLAAAVAAARAAGHEVVLVHGGGNQIRALTRRLGLAERYHQGLRVTDAETADVALMVLGGLVNRTLVAALVAAGVPAVGLTGADGATFAARKHAPGLDLGYVGEVASASASVVTLLLGAGIVPVLATVAPLAPGEDAPADRFYNLNADTCAGPLAAAFGADALLFLSDVPGVLDAAGRRMPALSPRECADLRAAGVIAGGMIPKVEAALAALEAAPGIVVKIAHADAEDAILAALAPDAGTAFAQPSATGARAVPSARRTGGSRPPRS
jgi:acetylglutamate kinase